MVIADAKRGDIGITMDAYARAWLTPGSPLEADALTVSPYLGPASLTGTLSSPSAQGKGVFVLGRDEQSRGRRTAGRADPDVAASDGERSLPATPATVSSVNGLHDL